MSLCLAACGSSSRDSKTTASPVAATRSQQVTPEDAKRFVQQFYDWYLPASAAQASTAQASRAVPLLDRPEMRAALAPELVRAWKEDEEAQARVRDEVVGLDGDPVTNAQDPCHRYQAVAARQTGETYWVEVRGDGGCAPHSSPDIVVQVACASRRCAIVNFHYPGPPASDLRSLLQQLREERAHRVTDHVTRSRHPRSSKE